MERVFKRKIYEKLLEWKEQEQLSSNASRYQVSSVISGSRVERLLRPLAILKDSMTTNISYHANDPSAGLALHINTEQFKLFCHDTGLFVTLAFWDSDFISNTIYQKLLNDKLGADLTIEPLLNSWTERKLSEL